MTDWKKRARELMLAQMPSGDGEEYFEQYICGEIAISAALQLGQEMQAETREILHEKILALETKVEALEELSTKAADARAEEIAQAIEGANIRVTSRKHDATSVQFGAKEASETCALLARSFISKKKTREEVLEEALRYMPCSCAHELETDASKHSVWCNRFVARRALEEADRLRSS